MRGERGRNEREERERRERIIEKQLVAWGIFNWLLFILFIKIGQSCGTRLNYKVGRRGYIVKDQWGFFLIEIYCLAKYILLFYIQNVKFPYLETLIFLLTMTTKEIQR